MLFEFDYISKTFYNILDNLNIGYNDRECYNSLDYFKRGRIF